jgi:hypothetical protein
MRRILSILVALVLGLGPGIAALPANALISGWTGKADESRLPACCRRNGKHHCAMPDTAENQAALSSGDSCPCMPHTLASTTGSATALLTAATSSLDFPAELRTMHGSTNAEHRSDRHNWPKRGPPATPIL